jgi:hypothetical protein
VWGKDVGIQDDGLAGLARVVKEKIDEEAM